MSHTLTNPGWWGWHKLWVLVSPTLKRTAPSLLDPKGKPVGSPVLVSVKRFFCNHQQVFSGEIAYKSVEKFSFCTSSGHVHVQLYICGRWYEKIICTWGIPEKSFQNVAQLN